MNFYNITTMFFHHFLFIIWGKSLSSLSPNTSRGRSGSNVTNTIILRVVIMEKKIKF